MRDGVRFGSVHVDFAAREVRRDGELQPLEPQAFDLLTALIAARERVVPQAELLDTVWGDQYVSASALTTRIKEVRRAVGDDGVQQAIIRNVRGRGYRFVAELERTEEVASTSRADLVGRDQELRVGCELMGDSRLLTVVGPGGVGKTTVGWRLARTAAGERGTDAIFVALASLGDPAAVEPAVCRAAGVTGTTDRPRAAVIGALDAVLVLDNCEHLIGAVADLVNRILMVGGPVRLVATSRERLGVSGEQVLPLEVLDVPAALELFVARAAAAEPSFELGDGDIELVERLAELVDRLPLAIEMAAARVHAVGLAELVDLLAGQLDVLTSADRSAAERHRTLATLVAWSERLLDPPAWRLFTDFSVFAGPVGADDVSGVLGGERGATLAALAGLVGSSLIVADTSGRSPRYRMLATIQAHAAHGRGPGADRRHASWFAEVADAADQRLRTTDEVEAHRRLEGIADELRAAHLWSREHDPRGAARLTASLDLFAHSRHWPEPAQWAELLMRAVGGQPPPAVLAAVAAEAAHQGRYERAAELARSTLDGGDSRTRTSALETLSDVHLYQGDTVEAERHAVELLHLGETVGDLHAVTSGTVGSVLARVYSGRPAEPASAAPAVQGQELAPSDQGWLCYADGELLAHRGTPGDADSDATTACYERAIELARQAGNRFLVGVCTISLLSWRARVGEPDEALAAFAPVLDDYHRSGDVTHQVTALRNLVDLLVRAGDDEVAMRVLGALTASTTKSSYGAELARLDAARATVEERRGAACTAAWMAASAGRGHGGAIGVALEHLAQRATRRRN